MNRDELLSQWSAMSEREKHSAVAVDVLGFTHYVGEDVPEAHRHYGEPVDTLEVWLRGEGPTTERHCKHCGDMPEYTTDHAAAYAVEERIEEMGLRREYYTELFTQCEEAEEWWSWMHSWEMIHATPAQRCCAAWVCCKMREGEK